MTDFGGFTGLTLTVQAIGNHDTAISPRISGSQFSNSMPTVNANSAPGYTFTFDGNGVVEVLGLTVSSPNNIFSRNIASTGFQVRERARFVVAGATWDSIAPNPVGNTGQLQISGAGSASGSVSINLPNTTQAEFNTGGFNAIASGPSITSLVYTYDLPLVTNGGQAPANLETNQPFSVTLEVVSVPEPSVLTISLLAIFGSLLRRKRS